MFPKIPELMVNNQTTYKENEERIICSALKYTKSLLGDNYTYTEKKPMEEYFLPSIILAVEHSETYDPQDLSLMDLPSLKHLKKLKSLFSDRKEIDMPNEIVLSSLDVDYVFSGQEALQIYEKLENPDPERAEIRRRFILESKEVYNKFKESL